MSCYHPVDATLVSYSDGSRSVRLVRDNKIHFGVAGAVDSEVMKLPCGKCVGCLTDRATDWFIRNFHEMYSHKLCSFLTLTYDRVHLPENGSLVKRDLQLFFKRLRKQLWSRYKVRVRYFAVGEYGSKLGRPHYHVILYGWNFPDRKLIGYSKHQLYVSDFLSRVWKLGFHRVGDVSLASIKYVSKYIVKRVYKDSNYYGLKIPEFNTCSVRPFIGRDFLVKYVDDLYNGDRVVIDATHKYRVPRAYDKWLRVNDECRYNVVKMKRKVSIVDYPEFVLRDREIYRIGCIESKGSRSYEGDLLYNGVKFLDVNVNFDGFNVWMKGENYGKEVICGC